MNEATETAPGIPLAVPIKRAMELLQLAEPKSQLQSLIALPSGRVAMVFDTKVVMFSSAMELETVVNYLERCEELKRQALKEAA